MKNNDMCSSGLCFQFKHAFEVQRTLDTFILYATDRKLLFRALNQFPFFFFTPLALLCCVKPGSLFKHNIIVVIKMHKVVKITQILLFYYVFIMLPINFF